MEKNKRVTVLVTRARDQALPLKTALRKAGANVTEVPLIKIIPPRSWKPFTDALRRRSRFEWIVITSVNGARFFLRGLRRMRLKPRDLGGRRIAAVGPRTAGVLKAAGFRVRLVPEAFTAEALFEVLRKKAPVRGKSFLLLRSGIASGDLPGKLRAAGAKVRDVSVYRTVPVRNAIKERLAKQLIQGKIDYVTLASASAARNFFGALPKRFWPRVKTRFITIGPVTSAALRAYGRRPAAEAAEHTVKGITEAFIHVSK